MTAKAVSQGQETRVAPSLSDRVISEIRQKIIAHELSPQQAFTEGEIAAMLGVSKSPTREALALLRRQGWVDVLPRSGYRVAPLTLHDAQNLTAVRLALEPESAAAAARRVGRWPDQAEALHAFAMAPNAWQAGRLDAERIVQHFRFHRRIAVLSGNTELERMLSDTLLKLQRYDRLQLAAGGSLECNVDHRRLAAAIVDQDAAAARSAAQEHAAEARDALLSALMSSETLLSANLSAGAEPPGVLAS